MSKRRSKNRRSLTRRSSNASDVFNENTDIIENDDPLWFDRTIIRPSTSLVLTRRESSFLSSDSTINVSKVSNTWFKNLSNSDISTLVQENLRKHMDDLSENEKSNGRNEDILKESESDQEFRKKRSKYVLHKKEQNKSDNSNAFLKALEKTIDSTTKTLSNVKITTENESESTNDESKTIKRLRPHIFKTKAPLKGNSKKFEEVFDSNDVSEKNTTTRKSLRILKKNMIKSGEHSLPEKEQKSTEISIQNVVNDNLTHINNDKTVIKSPRKKMRGKYTRKSKRTPVKLFQRSSDIEDIPSINDDAMNTSNTITTNLQKKRPTLFSQNSKNGAKQNLFDDVFQKNNQLHSENESNAIEPNESNSQKIINESESSSIPKNIRRTMTSTFAKAKDNHELEHKNSEKSEKAELIGLELQNESNQNLISTVNTSNTNKNVSKTVDSAAQNSKSQSLLRKSSRDNENLGDESHAKTNASKNYVNDLSQESLNKIISNITRTPLAEKSKEWLNDSENDTQVELSSLSPKNSPKKRVLKKRVVPVEKVFDKMLQTNTSINKLNSSANKSVNASSVNKSDAHEQIKDNSKQIISENESSSLPKFIRRTTSQVLQKSISSSINKGDQISDSPISSEAKSSEELDASKRFENNRENNLSNLNKSNFSSQNDVNNRKSNVLMAKQRLSKKATSHTSVVQNEQKNRRNQTIENFLKSREEIGEKSIQSTSKSRMPNTAMNLRNDSDGTLINSSNKQIYQTKIASKNFRSTSERKSPSTENDPSDDLIHTPHPAQSTLNPSGKPFTRVTEFSFRNSDIDETSSSQSASSHFAQDFVNTSKASRRDETVGSQLKAAKIDSSTTNQRTLETKQLRKNLSKNLSSVDEESLLSNVRSINSKRTSNVVTIKDYMWTEVQKKVDLIKEETLKRLEYEKEQKLKLEQEKARNEVEFKRSMALKNAELRRKQRKPIDPAFYVDGKLYKQPKLPRPKNWVSDRLYKYLWKCMEPRYGPRTRIKSEQFIQKISDISTIIIRRKKYHKYEEDLEDLLHTMAKLNIIKTRYDFYRFCSDFMPYNFRIKVVPMQLPGNVRNIPYDPNLVNEPILEIDNDS